MVQDCVMSEKASQKDRKTEAELGTQARSLVRSVDRGSLATTMRDDQWPYASLVMIATCYDGSPLLLILELAEHTQNILKDRRCGLLIDGTAGLDTPLTGSRITLTGNLQKTGGSGSIERYIRRHADAAIYAGFADFALYQMTVDRVHMVAGFSEIHWISGEAFRFNADAATALAEAEVDIIDHMNDDHGDAVTLYANNLLDLPPGGWRLTGVDPEGCDLKAAGTVARLAFDRIVSDAEQARTELVKLVKKARNSGDS
jgi:putative heme iron utilization protein